ncbi:MAG: PPOX class F420-dependent oxidoreductase [Actinomycetota bacterium]|nr:PPOX class F420-dependent oxidoreductase [Actinomycetota bacterium]
MTILTPQARALLESDALVHLVTLNRDGSPQLSCVWVGLDGEEIVSGHMQRRQKVRNVERDPRVVLSVEGQGANELGLREYLVVHGRARVQEGGAAKLLQRLAHVYLGPDVVFPPPGIDAPGYVIRITPERLGGVGPWTSG